MRFSDKLCLPSFIVDEARPASLSLNKFFAKKRSKLVRGIKCTTSWSSVICVWRKVFVRSQELLAAWSDERGERWSLASSLISSLMYLFPAQIDSESFLSLHCFIHKSSQSSLRDPDQPPVVVSSEVVGRVLRNRTSRVTKSLHLQRNYLCQGIEYWTLEHNSNRY